MGGTGAVTSRGGGADLKEFNVSLKSEFNNNSSQHWSSIPTSKIYAALIVDQSNDDLSIVTQDSYELRATNQKSQS